MTQSTAPLREAPTGLAAASIVLAVVVAALQVASAGAALRARGTVEALYAVDAMRPQEWIVLATLPALVAAYVVSCLWMQRARANAVAISPTVPHARGPVWVWLGWVVPIVNLWFPYQVVRDIRNGSVRYGQTVGIGLWWAAWLVWLVVPRRINGPRTRDDALLLNPDFDAFPVAAVVAAVAAVASCALWCTLVGQITAAQRTALSDPTPPSAPPPGAPRPASPALPPVPPRWSPHGDA